MNSGRIKGKILECYTDLSVWPQIDATGLEHDKPKSFEKFKRRRTALEMYVKGSTYKEIRNDTKVSAWEVRRFIERCTSQDGAGHIWGFRALVPGFHIKEYERTADVEPSPKLGTTGYAGALKQLFSRFPGLEGELCAYFFGVNTPTNPAESRVRYKDAFTWYKARLRTLGVKDDEYPFNSVTKGFHALRNYCRSVWESNPDRYSAARSGEDAAKRGGIGSGIKPLIAALRPYDFTQLDYHKIDTACTVIFVNERGYKARIPLKRWWVAFIVEEYSKAIIGAHVVLEANPSADAALETVESALRSEQFPVGHPARALLTEGKALISDFLPELSYQCFAVLKVDNAWSNSAADVIRNIQGTVGCAVNFGPPYYWPRRALVENRFGKFTAECMQRLPSTYGTGPGDTRRKNPVKAAMDLEISLNDIIALTYSTIAEINLTNMDSNLGASPVEALQHAFNTPESGFVYQPLPKSVQENMWLMMKLEKRTVRGSVKKNIRPYVNIDGDRYTNPFLANQFHLIGDKLNIYIDRRQANIVYAAVAASKVQIGRLQTNSAWGNSECSLQIRKLTKRSFKNQKFAYQRVDPVRALLTIAEQRLDACKKGSRNMMSSIALTLANHGYNMRSVEALQATRAAIAKANAKPVSIPVLPESAPAGTPLTPAPEALVQGVAAQATDAGAEIAPAPRKPRADVFSEFTLPDRRAITKR